MTESLYFTTTCLRELIEASSGDVRQAKEVRIKDLIKSS